MSVGTWEYTKIIFINSKSINISNLKLKDIKNKLVNEIDLATQSFKNGEDSLFTYLNVD